MKNNSVLLNSASKKILFLTLYICTFQIYTQAQERKLIYDILKSGNTIGEITLIEFTQGQKRFLSFTSDVKTKFIISITDHAAETAAFENGIMVYSSFHQKQNGSEKANKITIASGTSYKLTNNGVTKILSCSPIRYNMLLLYTNIPENINKVYSDNHQKLLDLKKIEENKYRLALPDGNYNFYTYKNGVCSKVIIERKLFTIQFVLRENSYTNISNK